MRLFLALLILAVSGCVSRPMGTSALIDRAILKHNSASQSIDLGDSKDSVLRTLSSVQAGVAAKNLKQPDK